MTTSLAQLKHAVTAVLARADGLARHTSLRDGLTAWRSRYQALPAAGVVVPIYNAAPKVAACLESLQRTLSPSTQVVLVDDHSPDRRIADLCDQFSSRRPGTTVCRNDQNVGWVASCNIGTSLLAADRDVVLLNSDTVLPSGWLEGLRWAAASRPNVATVSPLSNAAGFYSLPVPFGDSPLPAAVTPDLAALFVDLASPRIYESVRATCGFCLYVRRAAIDAVGLFDDSLFLRGYAEENDLCCRAEAAGFVNVCDDATFVVHAHGASFGGEKQDLKRRNGRILRALYPKHHGELAEYEAASRLVVVREGYRDLLAAYDQASDKARRWLQGAGSSVLGDQGEWSSAGRVIALADEIDLFGMLHGERRSAAADALTVRWSLWR